MNAPPMTTTSTALTSALRSIFGFSTFRHAQYECSMAILSPHPTQDVFVLAATGTGKSVCYQLPPLAAREMGIRATTLVVTPLIALMEDQCQQINSKTKLDAKTGRPCGDENGEPAAVFLGSSQSDRMAEQKALKGRFALVYLTPEKLMGWVRGDALNELARHCKVLCFAIDECHCVTEWGHSFRKDYAMLGVLRDRFPCVPILALTATATPRVQAQIVKELKMQNTLLLRTTFNRPNLLYRVVRKASSRAKDMGVIAQFAKNLNEDGGCMLVYVQTKKDADSIALDLATRYKLKTLSYHAGKSTELRRQIQQDFIHDRVQVLVATIAFGMGIDKPDVRVVVHYGLPKSLEGYYQETGRAGRDTLLSECCLMWEDTDVFSSHLDIDDEFRIQKESDHRIIQMLKFAMNTFRCRRVALLEHFGEQVTSQNCFGLNGVPCDVCQRLGTVTSSKPPVLQNFTKDAKILIKALHETGERFGANALLEYVMGRSNKRGSEITRGSAFGKGASKSQTFWKSLLFTCVSRNLARVEIRHFDGGRSFVLFGLNRAERAVKDLLESTMESTLAVLEDWQVPEEMSETYLSSDDVKVGVTKVAALGVSSLVGIDKELFEQLRVTRKALALERGILPYMVFGDEALVAFAVERPHTREAMLTMLGVGTYRFDRFGAAFLSAIKQFCESKGIITLVHQLASPGLSGQTASAVNTNEVMITASARETLKLFMAGNTLEEMMVEADQALRNRLIAHLCQCWTVRIGVIWDWNLQFRFAISPQMERAITQIVCARRPAPTRLHDADLGDVMEKLDMHFPDLFTEFRPKWDIMGDVKLVMAKILFCPTQPGGPSTIEDSQDPIEVSATQHPPHKRAHVAAESQVWTDDDDAVDEPDLPAPIPATPIVTREEREAQRERQCVERCRGDLLNMIRTNEEGLDETIAFEAMLCMEGMDKTVVETALNELLLDAIVYKRDGIVFML